MAVRVIDPGGAAARARHGRSLGILIEGDLFKRDVNGVVNANLKEVVSAVAAYGEAEAKRRVYGAPRKTPGPSFSGSHIRGRSIALGGKTWIATAVVSADTSDLNAKEAVRVQAALAGRHNPIASQRRSILGAITYRAVRNIGTTPGHEGTAKVFSGTASYLRNFIKNLDLTKGLG